MAPLSDLSQTNIRKYISMKNRELSILTIYSNLFQAVSTKRIIAMYFKSRAREKYAKISRVCVYNVDANTRVESYWK